MIEMLIRLWMDGCLRGNKIFREISKRNKTLKISRKWSKGNNKWAILTKELHACKSEDKRVLHIKKR